MKDIGERDVLTPGEIEALVRDVFLRAGLRPDSASAVARSIRRAETAGHRRLGLGLVPQMVEHLRCGRVQGEAIPQITNTAPSALIVDAEGGFACPAVALGFEDLCNRAGNQGIAVLTIINAYPVGSGLTFLDDCAGQGLTGLAEIAGLVPRAAPNGTLVLEIEQRPLGQRNPATISTVPLVPHGSEGPVGAPGFEGPLGPPFRLQHSFIALRPELWPQTHCRVSPPDKAVQNSGIAVSPLLLEKIINA